MTPYKIQHTLWPMFLFGVIYFCTLMNLDNHHARPGYFYGALLVFMSVQWFWALSYKFPHSIYLILLDVTLLIVVPGAMVLNFVLWLRPV